LGGKESSEAGTPLLPVTLSNRQGTPATLAGIPVIGRHRARHVQQVAQRVQPLRGSASLVQQNLTANAFFESVGAVEHHVDRITAPRAKPRHGKSEA
jgi:hypothetical protein